MSNEDPDQTAPASRRPHFRRANQPKLPPDAALRQGLVTKLALQSLGKDEAIAYLNRDNAALGGRPLDLATASADGFRRVELDLAPAQGDRTGD
ncbi:hypothetical protein [Novosphingobium soli]|uniref:DUF2384 domain-containing protein n=1 Tax=Novosphingobium soli TaxID=574956 RepID=A0ABV6CZ99_9SPHN